MSILSYLNLSYNRIFLITALISVFSLGLALFVEHVLEIPPCVLCIYQRIPYVILIIIGLIALYSKKCPKLYFVLIILTISSSIAISGYHSSVERGISAGTTLCNPDVVMPDDMSNDQIKEMLYNREVATCTKAPFRIMMLSMTEWNCLFNIFLLGLLLYLRKGLDNAQA